MYSMFIYYNNNNNSQIVPAKCEVWGDLDVHDLTPTCTRHIERPVSTDHSMFIYYIR